MLLAQTKSGPPGYPLVGHWLHFKRDRLGFLTDCNRNYGETVRLHIVSPTFLINNPDDIQHILVTREANYRKSWRVISRAGRRMFADALLTKRGRPHLRQRRLVQPAFHHLAITAFVDAINEHLESMLISWSSARQVNVSESIDRFAEDVIIRALVGDLDPETKRQLSEANRMRRSFINHAFRIQFPFPQMLPTRRNWEYQRASRRLRAILRECVRRVRAAGSGSDSLLALIAATGNSEGERLSDAALFEEVWELLTAGYETTREALTWSIYLMARHPDQTVRLRAEIREKVGERAIRGDDVAELTQAGMFFSEALRLYPPAWIFVRVAVEDDELPSGVRVAPGTKIFLCPYTAHRNEQYFPDAERFDPDRFLTEARQSRPKFAYFPFGGGRRVCVAESLARLEGVLVLAAVARRFDLALEPETAIEPVGLITLRPRTNVVLRVREANGSKHTSQTSAA